MYISYEVEIRQYVTTQLFIKQRSRDFVKALVALIAATLIYILIVTLTYMALVLRSPPGHNKPKATEVLAILLLGAGFFFLGYLLLVGLG